MKRIAILSTLLVFGLGAAAWAHHAPTEPVKIHAEGAKKEAVVYDHQKHFAAKPELQQNCNRCHHNVENTDAKKGEAPWKCTECHTAEGKDGAPGVKDAMHGKKGACRECHFGGDAVKRLKCGDCHNGGS